jgi:acetoacetate decarboxylase
MNPAYPPAPWRLIGTSLQTLAFIPLELAQASVPSPLRVVPVAPGRTLGGFFCARYTDGSTLQYHELAVSPALTRVGFRAGFWISHIYVDSAQSMRGGREIWSLPKQLATFRWRAGEIEVCDGPRRLCSVRWAPRRQEIPAPLFVPVLSLEGSCVYRFSVHGYLTAVPCRGLVTINPGAPFARFGFQGRSRVVQSTLRARIDAPRSLPLHDERQ